MTILFANTLFIAVIPVLALIILMVVSAILRAQRAKYILSAREEADRWQQKIRKQDNENKNNFVNGIIQGQGLDELVDVYGTARAQLFGGDAAWTGDDLQEAHRERLNTAEELAARRLMVQAASATALVIAIAVITCSILYHFESASVPSEPSPFSISAPASPGIDPDFAPIVIPAEQPSAKPMEDTQEVPTPGETMERPTTGEPMDRPVPEETMESPIPDKKMDRSTDEKAKQNLFTNKYRRMNMSTNNGEPKTDTAAAVLVEELLGGQKHPLSFPEAATSPKLRGATNVSMTKQADAAIDDASIILLDAVVDHQKQQKANESIDPESLDPRLSIEDASRGVQGIAELVDGFNGPDELRAGARLIRETYAGKPSRIQRDIRAAVDTSASDRFGRVRRVLERIASETPFQLADQVTEMRQIIDAIEMPQPSTKPISELTNISKALTALKSKHLAVARDHCDELFALLIQHAQGLVNQAIESIIEQLMVTAYRKEIDGLNAVLAQHEAYGHKFRENIQLVRSQLSEWRTEAHHRQAAASSSVVLQLNSVSADEWIASLRERRRCADIRELAQQLAEMWESNLNEQAAVGYPHIKTPARLGSLLARMPSEESARCFRDVLRKSMGDEHSVYCSIDQYGVKRAAKKLLEKAAPLSHLSARDNELFQVWPADITVVRLPAPAGPSDADIRKRLEDAFLKLDPACLREDTAEGEREITVMRVNAGWPIAIDESNDALLIYYAKCADMGHPPHLFGVLPDVADGMPRTDLVSLVNELQQEEL